MGEYITMLILGILLLPLGIMNIKGNISSIHWYNRTRITEETRPKYGKLMGIGTVVIGGVPEHCPECGKALKEE